MSHFRNLWSNGWRRAVLQRYVRTVEKWNRIDAAGSPSATLWEA